MRRVLSAATGCAFLAVIAVSPAFGSWGHVRGGCARLVYTESCEACGGPVVPVVTTYTSGAKISKVFYDADPPKDKPAANNSPLLEGDVILEADGQKVTTTQQLAGILDKTSGKTLRLVVLDPKTSRPFLVQLDLTPPKLKFGMKYDVVPVQVSASDYYLSRPTY